MPSPNDDIITVIFAKLIGDAAQFSRKHSDFHCSLLSSGQWGSTGAMSPTAGHCTAAKGDTLKWQWTLRSRRIQNSWVPSGNGRVLMAVTDTLDGQRLVCRRKWMSKLLIRAQPIQPEELICLQRILYEMTQIWLWHLKQAEQEEVSVHRTQVPRAPNSCREYRSSVPCKTFIFHCKTRWVSPIWNIEDS